MSTLAKPVRAPALAPHDRRAALIDAAVPLVLQRGFDVTTKELAAAAGVAEGTIFRVFDTKDDLVVAAARSIFARTDHLDDLRAISHELPLEARLTAAVAIWQTVARRMIAVFVAFHGAADRERLGDPHSLLDRSIAARADAIVAALFAPDVVRILGSLVLASVHPIDALRAASAPEDIVDLLLHGVLDDHVAAPDPCLTIPPREAPASCPAHAAYTER